MSVELLVGTTGIAAAGSARPAGNTATDSCESVEETLVGAQMIVHPEKPIGIEIIELISVGFSGMLALLLLVLRSFRVYFRSHADLQTEILALRHQIVVLRRQVPKPKLKPADRRFWVTLSRFWYRWRSALWIVKPATVIEWHRRGFRWYWTWKVRHGRPGRPCVDKETENSFGL